MNAQTSISDARMHIPSEAYMLWTNAFNSNGYAPEQKRFITEFDDLQTALCEAAEAGADHASIWVLSFTTGQLTDVTDITLASMREGFSDQRT